MSAEDSSSQHISALPRSQLSEFWFFLTVSFLSSHYFGSFAPHSPCEMWFMFTLPAKLGMFSVLFWYLCLFVYFTAVFVPDKVLFCYRLDLPFGLCFVCPPVLSSELHLPALTPWLSLIQWQKPDKQTCFKSEVNWMLWVIPLAHWNKIHWKGEKWHAGCFQTTNMSLGLVILLSN